MVLRPKQEVATESVSTEAQTDVIIEPLQASTTPSTETTTNSFTAAEVATHNSASDCWIVVDGDVYDVTEYVADGTHPGGAEILQGCGVSDQNLFANRPRNEGSHSAEAYAALAQYNIGSLKQ
ncbi:hypothetical protein KC686_03085 [Candidatus Woesebacteria bacterium]|nr:hypothetical protein [Candidatus Woesebacteria bacterium]